MSNPYIPPSLSGYNVTPPSDDTSETSQNQVTWQKHIDKIGDPLRGYIAAIDAAVLSAFADTFGSAVIAVSTNYTVGTADRGRFLSVINTTTVTLPQATDAGTGFPLLIVNTGNNIVTVDGDDTETINGSLTKTLLPGAGLMITCDGANWFGANLPRTNAGSFTPTHTGFSTAPSGDITWSVTDNIATVTFKFATATSDSTLWTITNWPAELQPDATLVVPLFGLVDNGTTVGTGAIEIGASSTATFYSSMAAALWTASGIKGFTVPTGREVITYPLTTIT